VAYSPRSAPEKVDSNGALLEATGFSHLADLRLYTGYDFEWLCPVATEHSA
jgi:hypothetical protein